MPYVTLPFHSIVIKKQLLYTFQILLQLSTGCCDTFDELFLEDQIQDDHRYTRNR